MLWLLTVMLAGMAWGQIQPPRLTVNIEVSGRPNQQALEEANNLYVDLLLATMNTDRNNYLSKDEIDNFIASIDANNDGNTDRCEFVPYISSTFNVTARAASFIYTLLNNQSNDDLSAINGVVFARDELTSTLSGDGYFLPDVRSQILLDVYWAATQGYQHVDLILANASTVLPPDGNAGANIYDTDGDGVLSVEEFMAVFPRRDTNGDNEISRCEFHSNMEPNNFDSAALSLVYDILDTDSNNRISRDEFLANLRNADTIVVDGVTTTEEYARRLDYMERVTRQQVGVPVRPVSYSCDWMSRPLPIAEPVFDVRLWVQDADVDLDGVITQAEYRNVVDGYYEINNNGNLSRCEFQTRTGPRYGGTMRQINAYYDALDTDRDDEVTPVDTDVTVADYDDDGSTTACELLLYMTYLTSQAEEYAARRAIETVQERERLAAQVSSRAGGQSA